MKARTLFLILWKIPSTFSPVHFAPAILTFNATQPEPLKELFKKQTSLHLPINPKDSQFNPSFPRQTKEKPIVAPTMLWVADTGSFRNVAMSSHRAPPTVTIWLS
jgi:hypothetical protein